MHTVHRLTAAVALAGAAALGLSGCAAKPSRTFPGLSGTQSLDKSVTALRGASSFTVSGKTMTKGVATQVNLSVSKTGECKGTMSLTTGYLKMVRAQGDVFLQSDKAFARVQTEGLPKEEADALFEDATTRWLRKEASDPALKGLVGLCDRDGMLKSFYGLPGTQQEGLTEVDGRPAVTITAAKHVFRVAADGEPYLLKVTAGGPEGIDLTYTGINEPVQVDVPDEKDVYEAD
ncbi:hypothetical protein [Streptomyces sp. NRRL F-4428]|uniref:hypothetical protein n=1 Tax=Streptomyces sp. NRRL F-4428 TaxID=1609137 RepID=UPI0005EC8341|nr:hypothetical protein [Streptomyces sp. NRRL F-4428]KJK46598.1 hypothetical protein UK14_22830 [Streptomyces sp. NRRL F-4428]